MKGLIYRTIRTLQVNFPQLQDFRFSLQRRYRTTFKIPVEDDFKALGIFGFTKDQIFVDAGANRGDTVQAIRISYPENKVMAFEPNVLVYEKSKKSFKNDRFTEFINAGLSDHDEELELNIPFYKGYMFDGLASFKENEALDWLKTRIFFFSEKNLSLKKINCKLRRLDDFNIDPKFIKIDVQGFELKVLIGAHETIKRSLPVLLIETPTKEVSAHLNALGYEPFKFDGKSALLPGHGDLNTFFVNKSSPVYAKIAA
jgi:FkbM family methyltransferase